MKKLIIYCFTIICFSCQTQSYKNFDFGSFTFVAPDTWKIIEIKGIDSYIRLIDIGHDTLSFDYGLYSNDLREKWPRLQPKRFLKELIQNGFDTTGWIFVDHERITVEVMKPFMKHTYDTLMVDGLKAIVISPKVARNGITGVYFDSVKTTSWGKKKFNFYGHNLKQEDQEELLKTIKTLKFAKEK